VTLSGYAYQLPGMRREFKIERKSDGAYIITGLPWKSWIKIDDSQPNPIYSTSPYYRLRDPFTMVGLWESLGKISANKSVCDDGSGGFTLSFSSSNRQNVHEEMRQRGYYPNRAFVGDMSLNRLWNSLYQIESGKNGHGGRSGGEFMVLLGAERLVEYWSSENPLDWAGDGENPPGGTFLFSRVSTEPDHSFCA